VEIHLFGRGLDVGAPEGIGIGTVERQGQFVGADEFGDGAVDDPGPCGREAGDGVIEGGGGGGVEIGGDDGVEDEDAGAPKAAARQVGGFGAAEDGVDQGRIFDRAAEGADSI
jgi:hypothetical protein